MKIIYPTQSTRVPKELVVAVKRVYEKRKETEPTLRMIDIWQGLVGEVK